jgi:hypothetical protein
MTIKLLAGLLCTTSLLLVGCDDGGDDDVNNASGNINAAAGDLEEAASEYGEEAADKLEEAREALHAEAVELREASTTPLTELRGSELAEHVRLRLAVAEEAVESNNFAAAKATLDKVQAVMANLPEEVQTQLSEAFELIDQAIEAEADAQKVRAVGDEVNPGE